MGKVDLRKELRQLYQPSSKAVAEVEVSAFTFLMIDGRGDPNRAVAYRSLLREAIAAAAKKDLPAIENLRIEEFAEGRCAQVLHVGPFSDEGPTIERLHAWIGERGHLRGKHHEIYLTDIRRAEPSRWKTVSRQPMQ
ncbi:MAG: GyrI-like domain-containing protein [Pseudomonadota bacterium]